MPPTLETDLEALFSSRADVAFALLFGSAASGRRTAESDVDLAVYFVDAPAGAPPALPDVEEPERSFPGEDEIWAQD
ncbi:MAG: nucleotidyltransferase domain-containing protein, partial [Spirochaetota bacterium]